MVERKYEFLGYQFSYLKAAFLAMEPSVNIIDLARKCGGGYLSEEVQFFILEHCLNSVIHEGFEQDFIYVKNIVKKIIIAVESNHGAVVEGLYEQLAHYMSSFQDSGSHSGRSRVLKHITFLTDDDGLENLSIPLQCSENMLEGDTGCVIWPSSLFLSEFILSNPNIFSNKCCFEVGSGVGLVGIVLNKVKASEVILSDGDLSTLENMKLNLDLNKLDTERTVVLQRPNETVYSVKCKHLPWETTSERELEAHRPDVILGADVIYDPTCVPHLIRLLSIFLTRRSSNDDANKNEECRAPPFPVAFIATVIRNVETFNCFLKLAMEARLTIIDITETNKPHSFLPYMVSTYNQANVRLYKLFSHI